MIEKVSGRQAFYVAVGVLLGTVFLPISQILAQTSGRDGWMAVIPGYFISYPFVYLTLYIYLKHPGKNLLEGAKDLLGKWLGIPFILIYTFTTLTFGGLLLYQAGELFARGVMIETPLPVFTVGVLFLLIFLVYSGLEVFARFNEIIVVPILLSLLFLIVVNIPKAEIGYLKPYLYTGVWPVVKGLLPVSTYGFEYILVLWLFIPTVNKPHEIIRHSLRAYIIVSLILTALTIAVFCVVSPEEAVRLFYPSLTLARMSETGTLFQGLEAFFIVFWLGANLLKTGAFLFCAYRSLMAILPFKNSLVKLTLVAAVFLAVTFVPKTGLGSIQLLDAIDKYLILPLGSAGTVLLALTAFIRSRGEK